MSSFGTGNSKYMAAVFNGDFEGSFGSADETGVTWLSTHSSYGAEGNVGQAVFDLRDFTAAGVTKVEVWCGSNSYSLPTYTLSLLDSSKSEIAGTSVETPRVGIPPCLLDVPVSGTPAYLKFTEPATYGGMYLGGIKVNGVLLYKKLKVVQALTTT